jgi:hypothetical protein
MVMNESTGNKPENSSCDCIRYSWVGRSSGWYCSQCGKWLCTLTGRDSIREPEFDVQSFRRSDLKLLSRAYVNDPLIHAYVKKHGTEQWQDLGYIEDATIDYKYTEAEQAIIEAFQDPFGFPGQTEPD